MTTLNVRMWDLRAKITRLLIADGLPCNRDHLYDVVDVALKYGQAKFDNGAVLFFLEDGSPEIALPTLGNKMRYAALNVFSRLTFRNESCYSLTA